MTAPKPAATAKKRDLVVTRILNAPVEMVWKAWIDPALVMRWWGPGDIDLLPGPHFAGLDLVATPGCGILNGLLVAEAAGSFAYQPPCCEKPAPTRA